MRTGRQFKCPECGHRHHQRGRCKECKARERRAVAARGEPFRHMADAPGRVSAVLYGDDWSPMTAE